MFEELAGIPRRIGNFVGNVFNQGKMVTGTPDDSNKQSFIDQLRSIIPGQMVAGIPDQNVQRQMFRIPEPTPTQTPAQGGLASKTFSGMVPKGESKQQPKGNKDKMTIKTQQPDGSMVTINVDMPTGTPTPTPTILPQFQGVQPGIQSDIQKFFTQKPLQGININDLINLAARESSLNPSLVHPNQDRHSSTDYGLFQINDYWQRNLLNELGLTEQDLLDPQVNMMVAYEIMRRQLEAGRNPFQLWAGAESLGLR